MNYLRLLPLVLFPLFGFSQSGNDSTSYVIIGTVVDGSNNELLSGANIVSSAHGTNSNDIGEFSIEVKENDTLSVSFVGYKTLTYICPEQTSGNYLIKFKLYKDSVSLAEVHVFPYPTYEEFKAAFLEKDEQDKKVSIEGVKTYVDKDESYKAPSAFSPVSFVYDRLFDKKARLRRTLKRRRETINKSMQVDD